MNELDPSEEVIFNAARQFADAEKLRQFLDLACEGEPEMRQRIERLLGSAQEADSFFGRNAVFAKNPLAPAAQPGSAQASAGFGEPAETVIGRYKLLQKIGEGGMGVVYMAEQEEPVRRRVALKIIKLGMDTQQVVARFEAERQALALMDHPNIAKVLDGGATDTGRPYFVMELVQGVPITEFCDKNRLPAQERLKLFILVCQAIQSAHQKGIIHRDLKPTNILVTLNAGVPHPMVIDFGVAKATQQKLTEKTLFTNFATMIGTPAYMSPEQAEMSRLDVDTRSDIYGLGVLLYELLTGTTPFPEKRLRSASYQEMQRIILEEEPERPSTRLSTLAGEQRSIVARNRGSSELALGRVFAGDLDWIVMKCLEKDRTRRYETTTGLAADLNRHLDNEPVVARPPTATYRLQKAIRRNKLAFMAGTAIALALMIGFGLATWMYVKERVARQQAVAAQKEAQQAKEKQESIRIEAEHQLYAAKMNLAQRAWAENNIGLLRQLLEETQDSPYRGFEWYYWQAKTHLPLKTLRGHLDQVSSVAFSPNGQRIVTGSHDNSAKVWDAASGQELLTLKGHTDKVCSVAFSPDGQRILTGSWDNTAKVWDAATGREIVTLSGHTDRIFSVAFSPDGQRIATGSFDYTAKVWEGASGHPLLTLTGHSNWVLSVAFSPDGQRILTGSADTTAKVWDAASAQELLTLAGHSNWVFSAAFSPNGQRIVTGSHDNSAKVWDAASGQELLTLKGHTDPVCSVAFSPDGQRILTGSWDNTAKVWEAASGRELLTLKGHSGEVESVAFSPDGRRILTGSWDGTAKVWEAVRGSGPLTLNGHSDEVFSVAFSPDGQRILTGSFDGTAKVWEAASGRELLTFTNQTVEIHSDEFTPYPKGHVARFFSVAFSPDGQRIVTGSSDGLAKVWEAASGRALHTLKGHADWVISAAFSPDGQRIVTGSDDRTAKVWDAASGKELLTLKGHSIGIASVAFSPDGQRIVTGSRDGTARVWETASGTELFTLKGHTDTVFSVAFSPDGQRIVTGSHDYTAKIWNAANGQEINTLNGHRSMVYSVAFSPDGRRIVTGSDDSTAKVWEAASGRELLTLTGHSGGVVSVAFSPDGQRIVTGSRDHTARVWQAARPEQVAAWRREEKAATEHLAALRQVQEGEGQAFALNSQGKLSEAEALFRQTIDAARKANDGDDLPNVLAGLGDLLRDQGKTAQAEPLYREGLALCRKVSPENCEQRQWLASVLALTLRNEGKMAEVEVLYLEAITNSAKLWPQNFPRWEWQYNGLMDVLQHEGKTNEVERLGQEFSAYANAGLLPPPIFKTGEEGLLYSSGMLHARAGQWTNAVAEFSKLVEMDPNEHWYHYYLAPLLAQSGDLKGYRRHCAQVLAIFGGTNNPIVAERMAKDCLMVPAAGIDLDAVARLADTAVMKGNGHQYFAYFEFVKGLAEYRQQHFARAIDWTQKALADPSVNYRNAQAYLVLAMAQHESGKLPECRVALDKGEQIIQAMPKLESGDIGDNWNDWIIVRLLRNEAKTMIGPQPVKAGQNSPARRN